MLSTTSRSTWTRFPYPLMYKPFRTPGDQPSWLDLSASGAGRVGLAPILPLFVIAGVRWASMARRAGTTTRRDRSVTG